jgi:hypothetical protein
MSTHRRIEEQSPDDSPDPFDRLDQLERTLAETLAEVELARRGSSYPWDAQPRRKHAGETRSNADEAEEPAAGP